MNSEQRILFLPFASSILRAMLDLQGREAESSPFSLGESQPKAACGSLVFRVILRVLFPLAQTQSIPVNSYDFPECDSAFQMSGATAAPSREGEGPAWHA